MNLLGCLGKSPGYLLRVATKVDINSVSSDYPFLINELSLVIDYCVAKEFAGSGMERMKVTSYGITIY